MVRKPSKIKSYQSVTRYKDVHNSLNGSEGLRIYFFLIYPSPHFI
jgi:hypothetical protein